MNTVPGFEHQVAAHCEAGSMRNLLVFHGMEISEEEVFGIASGPQFYFLKFVKAPGGMPLLGIRNRPGSIISNISRFTPAKINRKKFRTPEAAREFIDSNLENGIPTAVMVDMFYMNYLPSFLHVHAPFHFIVVIGKEENKYLLSDPYSEEPGILDASVLSTAMNTHAKMSRDNFCVTITPSDTELDRKDAYRKGILSTCKGMFFPPKFIGPSGIRMYADSIRKWTAGYSGSHLRDSAMFNAVSFEEQGTGGAAFRLMYASFLSRAGEEFGSEDLKEMSHQMRDHGMYWQDTSRLIISASRPIPIRDDEYPEWFEKNGTVLSEAYERIADRFEVIADFENDFFRRLQKLTQNLR